MKIKDFVLSEIAMSGEKYADCEFVDYVNDANYNSVMDVVNDVLIYIPDYYREMFLDDVKLYALTDGDWYEVEYSYEEV